MQWLMEVSSFSDVILAYSVIVWYLVPAVKMFIFTYVKVGVYFVMQAKSGLNLFEPFRKVAVLKKIVRHHLGCGGIVSFVHFVSVPKCPL